MTIPEEIANLNLSINTGTATSRDFLRLGLLEFVNPDHDPFHIVDLLRRAHEMDPENVDVIFWLGYVLHIDLCETPESERLMRMALDRDERRSDCLQFLAGNMAGAGRSASEYVDYLRAAVSYEPTWPLPRLNLANALRKVGMRKEAREMSESITPLLGQYDTIDDPVDEYIEQVITGRALSPIEFSRMTQILS